MQALAAARRNLANVHRRPLDFGSEVLLILAVHGGDGLHGVAEAFQRLAVVRIVGISATVAGVNLFLSVHEKDHERQVVVELEQIEIGVVNAREAHANKLIGDVFNLLKTDNLPVKYSAVKSRHATHDDHERLVGLGGQRLPVG